MNMCEKIEKMENCGLKIAGLGNRTKDTMLSIIRDGNYSKARSKKRINIKDLPVLFDNMDFIAYENGHAKLVKDFQVKKEIPCGLNDEIEYAVNSIYKLRTPKEKWRKVLWDLGLTKGNWRHPKMISKYPITKSITLNVLDDDNNIICMLSYFELDRNYKCWYSKPKTFDPNILFKLAVKLKEEINACDEKELEINFKLDYLL